MKTHQDLINYNNRVKTWLNKKPENKETALAYAIDRFVPHLDEIMVQHNKIITDFNKKHRDLQHKYQMSEKGTKKLIWGITKQTIKDEKGVETTTEIRIPEFTSENATIYENALEDEKDLYEKKMNEFLRQEVKIEDPYYASEIPSDLTMYEKEVFSGIVIDPEMLKK